MLRCRVAIFGQIWLDLVNFVILTNSFLEFSRMKKVSQKLAKFRKFTRLAKLFSKFDYLENVIV